MLARDRSYLEGGASSGQICEPHYVTKVDAGFLKRFGWNMFPHFKLLRDSPGNTGSC